MVVYTIGHSTRELNEFLELLEKFKIKAVIDVRRFPSSKKFPHFNKDNLEKALPEREIEYFWLEGLGGFRGRKHRPGKCLKAGGFEAYKQHMDSKEFKDDFEKMLSIVDEMPSAIMCAEKLYWKCHRIVLSWELVKKNKKVLHIIEEDDDVEHKKKELNF